MTAEPGETRPIQPADTALHPLSLDQVSVSRPVLPPAGPTAWAMMAGVMAVTFLAFLPVLDNGFVDWDDQILLVKNYNYRGIDWSHIKWMFTTRLMYHFQPLTWLTYALDYELWGMDPRGYHLTSLLFHVGAAGVFFWVVRRLLHLAMGRDASGAEVALAGAAGVAALVFAIHPLRAESVAWASERRDVTSGLFFMIALAAYLRAAAAAGRSRTQWLAVSLSAYVLSLMGKATGMTLPVVLVVLDAYPLRRLGPFGRGWAARRVRGVWLEKLPYLAIAIAAGVNAFLGQYRGPVMAPTELVSMSARVSTVSYAMGSSVYRTLLPLRLSPLYAPDSPFDPWAWYFVLSSVVVVLITASVVLAVRRWPAGLALWTTYVVMLAPVSGVFQIGPQIAADRYTYLSCLPWGVLAAALWLAVWNRRHRSAMWKAGFIGTSMVALTTLAALAWLTRHQAKAWHDSGSLWRQAVRAHPDNGQAHSNLGAWYDRQGQLDEALHHHHKAITYRPERAAGYGRLGFTLARVGRPAEAVAAYRQAVKINPRSVGAHTGLGVLLTRSRDFGKAKEGLEHLTQALRLKPTSTAARMNLAGYYLRAGRFIRAEATLRQGLELDPRNPRLGAKLAWLLATCFDPSIRDGPKALTLARQACQIAGHRNPGMLDVLAAALAETGQFDQAAMTARKAADLARQARDGESATAIEKRASAYAAGRAWRADR